MHEGSNYGPPDGRGIDDCRDGVGATTDRRHVRPRLGHVRRGATWRDGYADQLAPSQPQTAITSENGAYSFPRIPIGTYTVKFDMPGFKSRSCAKACASRSGSPPRSTRSSRSRKCRRRSRHGREPDQDIRSTTEQTTFDPEKLQSIPSARDPWVMLERARDFERPRQRRRHAVRPAVELRFARLGNRQ